VEEDNVERAEPCSRLSTVLGVVEVELLLSIRAAFAYRNVEHSKRHGDRHPDSRIREVEAWVTKSK